MKLSQKEWLAEYDKNFYIGCQLLNEGKITSGGIKDYMPSGSVFTINAANTLIVTHQCKTATNVKKNVKTIYEKLGLTRLTYNKAFSYTKYAIYFDLIGKN